MKKLILYTAFIIINLLQSTNSFSVDPEYDLRVKYFNLIAPNILEFEIYMLHTNTSATNFSYSIGQYIFTFNTAFANGGTLTYAHSPDPNISDLPVPQIPICPTIYNNELRLTSDYPPGTGNGFIMGTTGLGTKIVRMRLTTTACSFYGNLDLEWKTAADYYTKVYAYIGYHSRNIASSGTYYIDPFVPTISTNVTVTPTSKSYLTLADAFAAINAGTHGSSTTDVIVKINKNTLETTTPTLNANVFKTCTITPTANVSVSPNSCVANLDALILLLGSDKVTVNGDIGGTRSLTLKGEDKVTNCIKMQNGAKENLIKNIISENPTGVNIKVSSPATTGNNNNRIENCIIDGGTKGISISGNSSFTNDENNIIKNEIKNCTVSSISIGEYTLNSIVNENKIFNTIAVTASSFNAIEFYGNGNGNRNVTPVIPPNTISKNKIYNMNFSNGLINFTGINILPNQNIETILDVNNNFISIIQNTPNLISGIRTWVLSITDFTENIYFNSIYISGVTTPIANSYGIVFFQTNALAPTVSYNQKNNISVNERSGGTETLACLILHSGGLTLSVDYNNYWTNGKISQWLYSKYRNLPDYQCAAFPNEQNSIFKDVNFVDKISGDLHLNNVSPNGSIKDYDLIGIPITGIANDFDNASPQVFIRNTDAPYMGADEADAFTFDGRIRIKAFIDGFKVPGPSPVNVTVEIWDSDGSKVYNQLTSTPTVVTLSSSGTATIKCAAAIAPAHGKFHIVIKRPGCLDTWSKNGGETMPTVPGKFLNYDFTSSASQAFCSNMKTYGCKSYIFNGDIDGDGFIGIDDYTLVLNDAFPVQCPPPLDRGGSTTAGVPTGGQPTDLTNENPLYVDCSDVCLADESVWWTPQLVNNPANLINRPSLDIGGTTYSSQCINNPDVCTCLR